MTITLYKVIADKRALDKVSELTPVYSALPVYPLREVSVVNPVFIIDYSADYLSCNYVYCDLYDRYYYINNMQVDTAGRLNVYCDIDVRQSYSTAIKNVSCTVVRGGGQPTDVVDSKLPVNPSAKDITSVVMPENNNSFDVNASYSYLLTVVGGEPNINGG